MIKIEIQLVAPGYHVPYPASKKDKIQADIKASRCPVTCIYRGWPLTARKSSWWFERLKGPSVTMELGLTLDVEPWRPQRGIHLQEAWAVGNSCTVVFLDQHFTQRVLCFRTDRRRILEMRWAISTSLRLHSWFSESAIKDDILARSSRIPPCKV